MTSLGRGISLRRSFLSELAERLVRGERSVQSQLDWAELIPDNFVERGGKTRHNLLQIAEVLPTSLHGVSLSIGSTDPLDFDYLAKVKKLAREIKALWFTDHLSYSSTSGVYFHDLVPLPFHRKAIQHVVERVRQVQDFLDIPFGLENPSFYKIMPGSEMSEAEFVKEIVQQSGCRLLLDVNNIYVNSFNHSDKAPLEAALEYLNQMPLDYLQEVHVAGHTQTEIAGKPKLLDTHGAPVPQPVREILKALHKKSPIKNLLLEREANVPTLDEILGELNSLWNELPAQTQPRKKISPIQEVTL